MHLRSSPDVPILTRPTARQAYYREIAFYTEARSKVPAVWVQHGYPALGLVSQLAETSTLPKPVRVCICCGGDGAACRAANAAGCLLGSAHMAGQQTDGVVWCRPPPRLPVRASADWSQMRHRNSVMEGKSLADMATLKRAPAQQGAWPSLTLAVGQL